MTMQCWIRTETKHKSWYLSRLVEQLEGLQSYSEKRKSIDRFWFIESVTFEVESQSIQKHKHVLNEIN